MSLLIEDLARDRMREIQRDGERARQVRQARDLGSRIGIVGKPPGDLDALTLPDEAAWTDSRRPYLLY